jgi:hypothetical protein
MNLSLITLIPLVAFVRLILFFFGVIYLNKIEIAIHLFEGIVIFLKLKKKFILLIVLAALSYGAFINEHFMIHKILLLENRGICKDIINLQHIYLD